MAFDAVIHLTAVAAVFTSPTHIQPCTEELMMEREAQRTASFKKEALCIGAAEKGRAVAAAATVATGKAPTAPCKLREQLRLIRI